MKKILSFFIALLVIVAVALFTSTNILSPADELLKENLAALAYDMVENETDNNPSAGGTVKGKCYNNDPKDCIVDCPISTCLQQYKSSKGSTGDGIVTSGTCPSCGTAY